MKVLIPAVALILFVLGLVLGMTIANLIIKHL